MPLESHWLPAEDAETIKTAITALSEGKHIIVKFLSDPKRHLFQDAFVSTIKKTVLITLTFSQLKTFHALCQLGIAEVRIDPTNLYIFPGNREMVLKHLFSTGLIDCIHFNQFTASDEATLNPESDLSQLLQNRGCKIASMKVSKDFLHPANLSLFKPLFQNIRKLDLNPPCMDKATCEALLQILPPNLEELTLHLNGHSSTFKDLLLFVQGLGAFQRLGSLSYSGGYFARLSAKELIQLLDIHSAMKDLTRVSLLDNFHFHWLPNTSSRADWKELKATLLKTSVLSRLSAADIPAPPYIGGAGNAQTREKHNQHRAFINGHQKYFIATAEEAFIHFKKTLQNTLSVKTDASHSLPSQPVANAENSGSMEDVQKNRSLLDANIFPLIQQMAGLDSATFSANAIMTLIEKYLDNLDSKWFAGRKSASIKILLDKLQGYHAEENYESYRNTLREIAALARIRRHPWVDSAIGFFRGAKPFSPGENLADNLESAVTRMQP